MATSENEKKKKQHGFLLEQVILNAFTLFISPEFNRW